MLTFQGAKLAVTDITAPVAQLDRAPDYGSGGWGFKSLRARQAHGLQNLPGNALIMRFPSNFNLFWILPLFLCSPGCTTTTSVSGKPGEQPQGFFDKMMNQVTERECNVGRFICPYGLGPAGEACECTDPSGVVLNGRTVK